MWIPFVYYFWSSPYEVDIAPGLLPDMDSPQVDFETHPSTSHQITISILSSHHCVSKSVYTIGQPLKMGIKGIPIDQWTWIESLRSLAHRSPNQRKQQQQIMESSPSTGGFVFCMRAHGRGMEIDITTSRITPTLRSLFETRYTTIKSID